MKKKPLIALAVILLLGTVGATFAYFTNTATFENIFNTKPYSTKATENFNSPDNWTPGTTTPKTVTVENTGQVDVAVRVKLEGSWNRGLNGKIDTEDAAILNFASGYTSNWTYVSADGYYYYNSTLTPGATTSELLESVKFNEKVGASCTNVQTTPTSGQIVQTCASTGNGYDGATYTLKITIETIQADARQSVWKH